MHDLRILAYKEPIYESIENAQKNYFEFQYEEYIIHSKNLLNNPKDIPKKYEKILKFFEKFIKNDFPEDIKSFISIH